MTVKKFLVSCVCFILIVFLVACGNREINGKGEIIELSPDDIQAFVEEQKTGFIYVKDALESGIEDEKLIMREIERAAKKEDVNFYVFDQYKYEKYIELDLHSQSIGFYLNGEKKGELELARVNEQSQVEKKVDEFIKNVKTDYFE
ncbi:hypothetical protein M948_20470 [Virgibacillus sp. CM-4]|uniref:hypothetical protein n=1 Tax=Virgibacillus TaxID=84406 RepID=UPI0003884149|nr:MULTISPECIES: hypothetical protein [Virgibacillus]EQB34765.1 hypothetical protein M948_20470 [Virgibacillus sp. CM-4]